MAAAASTAPRRVLITGGSGFVGRALAVHAFSEGASVSILSRRPSPSAQTGSAHAVDLLDLDATQGLLAVLRPDIVVHAAGRTAPAADFAGREALWRQNVTATETLIEAVRRASPEAVIVGIGSAAQYGPPSDPGRAIEESDPWRPVGCYGVTKAAAGMALLERAASGQVRAVLGVLFNLIGPGQPAHLVPQTFLAQTAGPGPHAISVGDVEAARDFLDVRDAARALWKLALHAVETPVSGKVFNICQGRETRISEILEAMRLVAGGNLRWTSRGGADPVRRVVGDPSRLHLATGFAPEFTLARSMHDMWGASRSGAPRPERERGSADVVLEGA
jgi:GDP-4-dehydro-6-deoxy-D-mannose reductase